MKKLIYIGCFVSLALFEIPYGPLLSGYYFYKFYKKPITRDMTEEEFDAKMKSDIRNKKLKKLGI